MVFFCCRACSASIFVTFFLCPPRACPPPVRVALLLVVVVNLCRWKIRIPGARAPPVPSLTCIECSPPTLRSFRLLDRDRRPVAAMVGQRKAPAICVCVTIDFRCIRQPANLPAQIVWCQTLKSPLVVGTMAVVGCHKTHSPTSPANCTRNSGSSWVRRDAHSEGCLAFGCLLVACEC